jgi:Response regulator receiver domain
VSLFRDSEEFGPTALGGRPPGPGTCPPMSRKILIVEDDSQIRSAVTRALTVRGCAVASADTAMAGLQLGMSEHPDVVVLDLGIPGPARGRPPAPARSRRAPAPCLRPAPAVRSLSPAGSCRAATAPRANRRGPARTASVSFSSAGAAVTWKTQGRVGKVPPNDLRSPVTETAAGGAWLAAWFVMRP